MIVAPHLTLSHTRADARTCIATTPLIHSNFTQDSVGTARINSRSDDPTPRPWPGIALGAQKGITHAVARTGTIFTADTLALWGDSANEEPHTVDARYNGTVKSVYLFRYIEIPL